MKSTIKSALIKLSIFAAAAACLSLDVSPAQAGSANSNLSVTASVSANCIISTAAVAFGAYDPVSANASSALNGSGTVTVTCTNGSSATITLGQGSNADTGSTNAAPLRRMKDSGSDFLSYSLFQDSARTTVWGNTSGTGVGHNGDGTSTDITVYGKIPGGQNVPADSYSDSVVATVTF